MYRINVSDKLTCKPCRYTSFPFLQQSFFTFANKNTKNNNYED